MKEIVIATNNEGKLREFNTLLTPYFDQIYSLKDMSLHTINIKETGKTFHENAEIKAKTISEYSKLPVLADDSGLVVDVLDGRPGVYSARFAGTNATDKENYEKVLHALQGIEVEKRTARFVCVIAFVIPNQETVFTEGVCEGTIAIEPTGSHGFGYDPIFIPKGYDVTMAELTAEEKNKISHRAKAMKQFVQWLKQNEL